MVDRIHQVNKKLRIFHYSDNVKPPFSVTAVTNCMTAYFSIEPLYLQRSSIPKYMIISLKTVTSNLVYHCSFHGAFDCINEDCLNNLMEHIHHE